jgi:hypothetical protein
MSVTITSKRNIKRDSTRSHARRRSKGEAIHMRSKRFGYFPESFVWRGRQYTVHAVERCWTVSRRWLWEVERHCFRVRCPEGNFELYQDVKNNSWHVDRFERA